MIPYPRYLHCIYILVRACFHRRPVMLHSVLFVNKADVEVGERKWLAKQLC